MKNGLGERDGGVDKGRLELIVAMAALCGGMGSRRGWQGVEAEALMPTRRL